MDINLDLYKTFVVVARNKSMTKAAEELFISQPAISKSIQLLEEKLNTTLFIRSNKGLELTHNGNLLYPKIVTVLNLIQDVQNEFEEFQELNNGEIRIGISSVLTKCLLLDTLSLFKMKYPNIKISIVNGLTNELFEKLKNGLLNFVIYNEMDNIPTYIDSNFLTTLDYAFCYHPKFYEITDNLFEYPIILQPETSNTRLFLDKHIKTTIQPYMEVVSQDLICELVNSGLGIGFAYSKIIDKYPNLEKILFDTSSQIYYATNKNMTNSLATKTFIKELKKHLLKY